MWWVERHVKTDMLNASLDGVCAGNMKQIQENVVSVLSHSIFLSSVTDNYVQVQDRAWT